MSGLSMDAACVGGTRLCQTHPDRLRTRRPAPPGAGRSRTLALLGQQMHRIEPASGVTSTTTPASTADPPPSLLRPSATACITS
jgi:hypothetical protein